MKLRLLLSEYETIAGADSPAKNIVIGNAEPLTNLLNGPQGGALLAVLQSKQT